MDAVPEAKALPISCCELQENLEILSRIDCEERRLKSLCQKEIIPMHMQNRHKAPLMGAALAVAALLSPGCQRPAAGPWPQFHADGPNQGFNPISSSYALQPKWTVEVGPVVHSSPVIDADGTIYIGTTDGRLVAVNPDGTIKCTATFADAVILSTPSVGGDGNIYFISIQRADERLRSTLHSSNADCNVRWSADLPDASPELPSSTSSSAKTWSPNDGQDQYVFVTAQFTKQCTWETDNCNDPDDGLNELLVFDSTGTLVTRKTFGGCITAGGGGGTGGFLEAIWDFITSIGEPGVIGDPAKPLHEQYGWLAPTPAIVEFGSAASPSEPLIVTVGTCSGLRLSTFRFSPPTLTRIWLHEDESDKYLYSSPAVFFDGQIVFGRRDGLIQSFDIGSGDELWTFDANDPVMATPASFGRQIYVPSLKDLYMLDADGEFLKKLPLAGQTLASTALSGDLGYLSLTGGLQTFSFDLAVYSVDGNANSGLSSPAIGADGTIYTVASPTELRAYERL